MEVERLEAETNITGGDPEPLSVMDAAVREIEEQVEASRLTPTVQAMIERMLDGKEPYGRDLKPLEPMKFSPTHVNICTLKAAGFKGNEIAQMVGLDPVRVSTILRHPYGQKLVKALVPQNSARVMDIRTKLVEYADDLLDATFELAMKSQDAEEVAKVTFGLLDRAGYAPKTSPTTGERPVGTGLENTHLLGRIAGALLESQQVSQNIMPTYVQRRPPEEGVLPGSEVVGSSDKVAPLSHDVSGSPPELGSQVAARRRA